MKPINIAIINSISECKNKEPNFIYLIGCQLDDIVKICKAWTLSNIQIEPSLFNGQNIWECIFLDADKFLQLAGNTKAGTFEGLIKADILYPDGTFNANFVNNLICIQEAKNHQSH